jgi:glycosyltransferase domain-containing protein
MLFDTVNFCHLVPLDMGSDLNNLTLCVFTRDRPEHVERLLNYYDKHQISIIILDASKNPLNLITNRQVLYFHVPDMSLAARLVMFSKLVKTKYIVLSPDDDFYSIPGLVKTLNFLDTNNDYSSAQGLRVRFYDYPRFSWIPDYTKHLHLDFDQNSGFERVKQMAISFHYIYSVIRKEDYFHTVSCLEDIDLSKEESLSITEYIFNYCLAIFGKHKLLPHFYQFRKAHLQTYLPTNYPKWISNSKDESVNRLKSRIVYLYSIRMKIEIELASKIYEELTEHFVAVNTGKKPQTDQGIKLFFNKYVRSKVPFFENLRFLRFRYFKFYALLRQNNMLLKSGYEIIALRKFLRHNHLNSSH